MFFFKRWRHALGALWLFISGAFSFAAETPALLGRVVIPHELPFATTLVGGFSGISYDVTTKTFWAVSDDSADHGGPPRVYQLRLAGSATAGFSVNILRVVPLRDDGGRVFDVADAEGVACTGKDSFWVSSEGRAGKKGASPWLRLFSQKTGKQLRELPLPAVYLPADAAQHPVRIGDRDQKSGLAANKSLESCAISGDRRFLYTASEASLLQEKSPGEDKGGASLFNRTQVRISALDTGSGQCVAQKLYVVDGGCFYGSVSDLFWVGENRLLVLERRVVALQEGPGSCQMLLHEVDLSENGATDLRKVTAVGRSGISPLSKKLIFDSTQAGLKDIDNIEGFCLASLPGGQRGLVAVSDNNFNTRQQTQILIFSYPDL